MSWCFINSFLLLWRVSTKEVFLKSYQSFQSLIYYERPRARCLQSNFWSRSQRRTVVRALLSDTGCIWSLLFALGPCRLNQDSRDVFLRAGWAVFCTSSCQLWVGTLSPRCTCWRIHSFSTGGNEQPSTAHTSHTEEVRGRLVVCLERGEPRCPAGCREGWQTRKGAMEVAGCLLLKCFYVTYPHFIVAHC